MLKVYTASKLKHAPMWRELCASQPYVQFHARWLKHVALGTPDTPDNAVRFWEEDERDVHGSDALIVYAEEGEHLRGALVEVGMAIAFGVDVIVVGEHQDYGTWQYHPGVVRVASLEKAIDILRAREDAKY